MKTAFVRARALATLWLLLALPPFLWPQAQPAADLIILNAKVWTVDKTHPTAQAVAVLGDRIVAVGSNGDVKAWHGVRTRIDRRIGQAIAPWLQRLPRAFCRWRLVSRQRAAE